MAEENPEKFAAGVWQQIEEDDIFPSQAGNLFNEVQNACLTDLVRHDTIDPTRVGKIVLILGILATKNKKYVQAIRYLKWSVNLYSHCKNLVEEWGNLPLPGNNPPDEAHVNRKLLMAHHHLGKVYEETGLIKEASHHFKKGFELFIHIPNPRVSSVQGFGYFNLSIWAFKRLEFEKAIVLGNKSVQFFKELPSSVIENKIQLGKSLKLLSLIHSTKGDEEKSKELRQQSEEVLELIPGTNRIFLDILYMEIEIFLQNGGAQGEDTFELDRILSLDDWDVSERLGILGWKLILHHHQKDMQKLNQCADVLKALARQEDDITEDVAKALYGLSKILYINKKYQVALDLVTDLLTEDGLAIVLQSDLKGRLNLLKGEILMSLNADEPSIMNCFHYAGHFLEECFSEEHYVIAHLHQCAAQAHLRFGRASSADQSLKEARDIITTSFSRHSLTSMKLDFVFVEAYTHKKKFRSAIKLLEEMVKIMETCQIMPHEPFCYDSKWQSAELAIVPQDKLLVEAKDWLTELKQKTG